MAVLGLPCSMQASFSCVEQGLLFVAVGRPLIAVASLVAEYGLQACGLQQLWLADSRAQAQQLWHMGLVAPWHVGSSQTKDRTCVSCIGRWILIHCATREVPIILFLLSVILKGKRKAARVLSLISSVLGLSCSKYLIMLNKQMIRSANSI